jgi:hypothetical protein
MTWYGTSNNLLLQADTSRRVCCIRLETPEERPEDREDFRHPNLLDWVRQERTRLLGAALTILSAYCRTGQLDQKLRPWGSYEAWTRFIRGAVVWIGLPDPGDTRMTDAEGGDREAAALQGLLAGWREIDPNNQGMTAAQVITRLDDQAFKNSYPILRGVLADLFDVPPGHLPSTRRLGYKLRAFKGRNCGGWCFHAETTHDSTIRWRVRKLSDSTHKNSTFGGDGGDCPAAPARARENHSPSHSHASRSGGGTMTPITPITPIPEDIEDGIEDAAQTYETFEV